MITRRRVVFLVILGTLALVSVFAIIQTGRIAGTGLRVVVSEPPPGKSSGTFVMRVPGSQADGVAADTAPDETPAGQLVAAARAGDITRLEQLVVEGVSVDAASGGYRALHRAAEAGSIPVLEVLVVEGAEIDATDPSGNTALTRAALFGQADAVALLLNVGADPNAHAEPENQTPLMGLLLGWQLGRSENPLGILPREEERLTAARTLVAAGANPGLAPTGMFSAAMLADALGVEELRTLFAEAE